MQLDEIERLTPYAFPQLMDKILRAELTALKLRQSELILSFNITDPDGGLDAYIGSEVPVDHPWLPKGKSGWQFKAVTSFTVGETENEVLNSTHHGLKPRIDKLLTEDACYVLVISRKDYVEQELTARENALKEIFRQYGHPNSRVKVFSSGLIAKWASSLPSVVAYLKPDRVNFKDIFEWEKTIHLQEEFVPDNARTTLIEEFRKLIVDNQGNNRSTIIRLVGLSGVGKTRLTFECLNSVNLKDVVLYLETPDKLPPSKFNEIAQNTEVRVILVIDDCPHESFVELAKEAEPIGGRLAFFALDYDIDKRRDVKDIYKELYPLDNASSEKLVKKVAPELPGNAQRKIIEFSQGFPIILSRLSQNFASHPDILSADTLDELGIADVLDRIIEGRGGGAFSLDLIRKFLTSMALFKRIGWDEELSIQGQRLCEIRGIDWAEARGVVEEQERRKLVVKGGRYRYVTPLPLVINLSSTWLRGMDNQSVREFYLRLTPEMQEAFLERLGELGYTGFAKEVLRDFLSKFDYDTLNSEIGSQIFLNLSKADHAYSMSTLERILSPCSREQLLQFGAGRRSAVWVLEKNAWWKDTFSNAAAMLLRLADAENESWSNNATGTFIALFQTFLGGTEVPVWERFTVLKVALSSGNRNFQKIAIKAIGSSLNLTHAFRASAGEEQGFVIPPPEWEPRTRSDIEKAVKDAFALMDEAARLADREVQLIAMRLILSHARELISIGFLELVLEKLAFIQSNYPELNSDLIATIEQIIYYDGKRMPNQMLDTIKNFRDRVIGGSFQGLLARYVLTSLIEDQFEDNRKIVHNEIKKLAAAAVQNPSVLEPEIESLTASQTENTYVFGKTLGEIDSENKWLYRIYEAIKSLTKSPVFLFSGYLAALKVRDETFYRQCINKWLGSLPSETVTELIWRSGATDWDAKLVVELLRQDKIKPLQIGVFLYGAWFKPVSLPIFKELLEVFSKKADARSSLAIVGIIDQYTEAHKEILEEKELILSILNKASFKKSDMESYYWNKVLQSLADKYPESIPAYVDLTLNKLLENLTLDPEVEDRLRQFLMKNPKGTWDKIKEKLNVGNLISWKLVEIIKGQYTIGQPQRSLFSLIPEEEIWEWVDADPTKTPYLLARMIPMRELEPNLHPIARKLMLKFPENNEIKDSLLSNWFTEGFSGKASEHNKEKLKVLEVWEKDPEKTISLWAKAEEPRLKQIIKKEEIREAEAMQT